MASQQQARGACARHHPSASQQARRGSNLGSAACAPHQDAQGPTGNVRGSSPRSSTLREERIALGVRRVPAPSSPPRGWLPDASSADAAADAGRATRAGLRRGGTACCACGSAAPGLGGSAAATPSRAASAGLGCAAAGSGDDVGAAAASAPAGACAAASGAQAAVGAAAAAVVAAAAMPVSGATPPLETPNAEPARG
jgi:hypothetical protein